MPDRMLDRCQIDFFWAKRTNNGQLDPYLEGYPIPTRTSPSCNCLGYIAASQLSYGFNAFSANLVPRGCCRTLFVHMWLWPCAFFNLFLSPWSHEIKMCIIDHNCSVDLYQVLCQVCIRCIMVHPTKLCSSCPKRDLGFSPHFLRRLPSERPFWIATG